MIDIYTHNMCGDYFLVLGPQKEVVSIYNDDFKTPKSRYFYFIEVYRCIKAKFDPFLNLNNDKYPMNNTFTEIKIVFRILPMTNRTIA